MRRASDFYERGDRRRANDEHIVQPRRSVVTPAKAQPEKYHGVVRELYVARVFSNVVRCCFFIARNYYYANEKTEIKNPQHDFSSNKPLKKI